MILVALTAIFYFSCSWVIVGSGRSDKLSPSDRLTEMCLLSMTGFYGLPILLGILTGHINTLTIIASLAIFMGFTIALIWRQGWAMPCTGLLSALKALRWHEKIALAAIMAILAFTAIFGSALPARSFDASSYHILGPIRWVQSGRFIFDSFGDVEPWPYLAAAQTYPNVKGIVPFLVMLWGKSTAGTALTQWPFYVLLTCASYALYRRLLIPRFYAMIGVLFCLTAPEVLLQSVEAYADLAYFAATMAVIWIILRIWQDGQSLQSLLYGAMAFTALAGTKPTAAIACVALGSLYLIVIFSRPGQESNISYRIKITAIALTAVLILSISISGAWPIRALINFNNPVYPVGVDVMGKTLFHGPYPASMNLDFQERYTGRSGWHALWGTLSEQWRPAVISTWSSGLGMPAFVIGIPALFTFLLFFWAFKKPSGLWVTLLAFLLLALTSKALSLARFSLFTLGLGGLAIGMLSLWLHRVPRRLLTAVTLACIGYSIYITFPSILVRPRPAGLVMYNLASGSSRSSQTDNFPEDYNARDYWLDMVASKNTRLAIIDSIKTWNVFDPVTKPDIIRIPETESDNFADWLKKVRQSNATHLLLPQTSKYYSPAIKSPDSLELVYNEVTGRALRAPFMDPPPRLGLFKLKGQQ